jgi:hypothetical protein
VQFWIAGSTKTANFAWSKKNSVGIADILCFARYLLRDIRLRRYLLRDIRLRRYLLRDSCASHVIFVFGKTFDF